MQSGPVKQKRFQKPSESEIARCPADADPQRIPVVNAGHALSHRKALLSKGPVAEVRSNPQEHGKAAGIKNRPEQNCNYDAPQHGLERDGRLIGIQEELQSIAEADDEHISKEAQKRPGG